MKTARWMAWEQLNNDIVTCDRCPRLVEWRERIAREKRAAYRDWDYWGRPVPGFGDPDPRLFVVGLAPGAHGANRTGRMFTGDSSAHTLAAALHRAGFASQPTSSEREDGLALHETFLSAVARCAPPANKLTADEAANCRRFMARELALCPSVRVVLALGHTAFDGYLRVLQDRGVDVPRLKPRHGDCFTLSPDLPVLAFSYHPSRQNTQTGRLTPEMLDSLFCRLKTYW